jgi:hypothetical protein
MLPVSLDCPFLIALSVFSNVYLKKVRHPQAYVTLVKTNNLKFFGSNKENLKGTRQDSPNRPRSHMPEGGEPFLDKR